MLGINIIHIREAVTLKKIMQKLAMMISALMLFNTVLGGVSLQVMAADVQKSFTLSIGVDEGVTPPAHYNVEYCVVDNDGATIEGYENGVVNEETGSSNINITVPDNANIKFTVQTAGLGVKLNGAPESETRTIPVSQLGSTYAFLLVSNGQQGPGPQAPQVGAIDVQTSASEKGTVQYKIGSGQWRTLQGGGFTLNPDSELNNVANGTKIYFKATPDNGCNVVSTCKVRYDETDHAIAASTLTDGSFYIEYDNSKTYSVSLGFEGDLANPITISLSVDSSCYEDFFYTAENDRRIDGKNAKSGSVTVAGATNHTLSFQVDFGAAISKIIVNNTEYTPTEGADSWYSVEVPEAASYTVKLVKGESNVATIVWAYDHDVAVEKYGNDDAWVENGKVEIVKITRGGNVIFDEQTSNQASFGIGDDGGDVFLEKGDDIILRLIPDYGYQLVNVTLNGTETLVPDDNNVSTFELDNLQGNLHFKGVFVDSEDVIRDQSSLVNNINIENGENAASTGNLRLTVADKSNYRKNVSSAVEADNVEVVGALDLGLENIVNKGTGANNNWESTITSFTNPIDISLEVDFGLLDEGEEFTVVRDHNGQLEELDVNNDWDNGVISFETNKFSTYSIVKKSNESGHVHEWDEGSVIKYPTPKSTGTMIYRCTGCDETYTETLDKIPQENAITEMVVRFYDFCLCRDPEQEGVEYWSQQLKNGATDGSSLGAGFVFSQEYMEKNTTNSAYLNMLYVVFMGREADEEGFRYWKSQMKNGMTREEVFKCFVESKEYTSLCEEYGINRGEYTIQGIADPGEKEGNVTQEIIDFVEGLYLSALGRPSDPEGVAYWSQEIANETKDPVEVAKLFFFSEEFESKKLSNEQYVIVLYETFMGREGEESGINYWVGKLNKNVSREDVLDAFTGCKEFQDRVAGF